MTAWAYDVRFAIRSFKRSPGFVATVLIVLLLGVGASTAVFSVVDGVVLRPIGFDGADRLINLAEVSASGRPSGGSVAPQNFFEWRERQGGVFEDLAATAGNGLTFRDRTEPELIQTVAVSSSLFGMLRVHPTMGQLFTAENEIEGHHRVLLISDGLWRRRFGADPQIVGRAIPTNDGIWVIAGVMAPEFAYPIGLPKPIEAWAPFVMTSQLRQRDGVARAYYLRVIGRLSPGTTLEQARMKMEQVTADLAREYPVWFVDKAIKLAPLKDALVGDLGRPMVALLMAVTLVLLIACVNVANMVLARSAIRRREVAIRTAIGASRWAIVRSVLVENLILSFAGTAMGVFVAWWGVHAIMSFLPANLPRLSSVDVNLRVLVAAAVTSILTGVLFGVFPAWQLSRQDASTALGQSTTGVRTANAGRRLRTAFIVSEVAIAVALVIGAVLFLSSFARMMRVDTGLDYRQVVSVNVRARVDLSAPERRDAEIARGGDLLRQVRAHVDQMAGIDATAWYTAGGQLWSGGSATTSLAVPGRPELRVPENQAQTKTVSPGYFKTMGIRVVRGREFDAQDLAAGADGVIVSEAAARRFFGEIDIVGQPVQVGRDRRTVVGVVEGVRLNGPESDLDPEVYRPADELATIGGTLYIRVAPHAQISAEMIKRAIDDLHLEVAVSNPASLRTAFDLLVRPRTLNTLLVSLFGALALIIAAAGVYGVMAYVVAQRAGEMGIRVALGGQPAQLKRSVLRDALRLVLIGAVIGTVGAALLARFVSSFLFQVSARDPWLYLGAIAILLAVGALAAYVPAQRAARVNPIDVLRA